LRVEGGDTPLPDIIEFSVGPDNFTPNQDGVNDRVIINVFLQKDSELDVYLLNEIEQRIPVPRREEGQNAGESGRHVFDYDGGIDNGVDPPVDGTYLLVADAQDDEGQIIRRSTPLTIRDGGLPRAEIVAQPVGPTVVFDFMPYDEKYFSYLDDEMQLVLGEFIAPPDDSDSLSLDPITMPLGDMLVFKLTIENYGTAPIRTTGPPPGTVYQQDQTVSSLGQYDRSGAWRVGIECETSLSPYPWRWAIGTDDNLYTEEDPTNDNVYSYLAPGERSVVWGAVRMTQLVGTLNPQDCWAGLIHEDVGISIQNSQVGRRPIRLAEMSPATDNG